MKCVEVVVVYSSLSVVIVVFFVVFGVVSGVVFGVVFGVVGMSSLVHVDGLSGSKVLILAARVARLMHSGGSLMGVCGFWFVDGSDCVVVIIVVTVVVVAQRSTV